MPKIICESNLEYKRNAIYAVSNNLMENTSLKISSTIIVDALVEDDGGDI